MESKSAPASARPSKTAFTQTHHRQRVKPVFRAQIAAGVAGAAGLGLLASGQWGPGIGTLSVSLATLLLITERGLPDELPDASVHGIQEGLSALARDLHLGGNGIVVPPPSLEGASHLFIPVGETPLEAIKTLDHTILIHRDASAPLGLTLPPPGAGLEALWRSKNGLPEGRGPEEAADHVRRSFSHLGLGRQVSMARAKNTLRVTYEPLAYADACRRSRTQDAPWHLQGGCPACSFVAILVARAHAAPVRVAHAGDEGARVVLDLEVGERSTA